VPSSTPLPPTPPPEGGEREKARCFIGLKPPLTNLPVSPLRPPADTLEMLSRLGIATIKQLTGLSRVALAERFGAQLLLRLDQAFGLADEIIVPYRPAPTFEAAFQLEYPTDRRDVID